MIRTSFMTTTVTMGFSTKLLTIGVLAAGLALGACGEPAGEGPKTAEAAKHPLVGQPAPAFELESLNGQGKVSIEKWKGKVVYVDFWATWCEPCKKSFPKIQELYTKYKGQVEVVGISEDDENTGIKEFGEQFSAKFPLGWDKGKDIAGKWQPKSMPASFVVDKQGVVRFVHLGYHDGEEAEIEKEIKSLL
jgi:cytochrome c biogenesis protein CcmG, thiol:disulfide interchange protein DsbE